MFYILQRIFLASMMIPCFLLSSEVSKEKKQDSLEEIRKKRDEDAQRYKRIVTALGGKMLGHATESETTSSITPNKTSNNIKKTVNDDELQRIHRLKDQEFKRAIERLETIVESRLPESKL